MKNRYGIDIWSDDNFFIRVNVFKCIQLPYLLNETYARNFYRAFTNCLHISNDEVYVLRLLNRVVDYLACIDGFNYNCYAIGLYFIF